VKSLVICVVSLILLSSSHAQDKIVIGWNDLGMHCSNKDFSSLVILPPYNNVRAQVIQVGDSTRLPLVLTTGFRVGYEIPGNTYSVGKTNFWDFEDQLFGVSLPPNIGLTGVGLSGDMEIHENFFKVEGVPITPFVDADLVNEDPFQLGLLTLYDHTGTPLATTQPVIPVSNEINCVSSGCHSSEQNILNEHDDEGGFDPNNKPILCATCHASNALGAPGQPGLPSLSEAIHKKHGDRTNDCYKCHPGPNTQCLRGTMATDYHMTCQSCHGSVTEVGESISSGREPWFDEPSCGDPACHGSQYAEEPGKLFRESRGHGGLFCSACHGEPHAILPSGNARDNVQNIALQGYAGTLNNCVTCHGVVPDGPGPHGVSVVTCCEGTRGNVQLQPNCNAGDQGVDVSDLTNLIDHLFINFTAICCPEEADIAPMASPDGSIDVGDLTALIDHLFITFPALPACP